MNAPTSPGKRPKILYVLVEDFFFVSHFLSFARDAVANGFDVCVVTRVNAARAAIEATSARVIAITGDRGTLGPAALLDESAQLQRIFKQEQPDIVHLIGLRPIVTGAIPARMAGLSRRVIALTGTGLLGAGNTFKARLARMLLRLILRPLTDGRDVHYVFENRTDPAMLGLSPDQPGKVTILGGAGVDPEAYPVRPLPPQPPLRLAMIARMLWSKGADTAVEAVELAHARGANVELSLYGAPDLQNPRALPEATLRDWASRPGISWHGHTHDVPAVWAAHHADIQPSRGGEGLPRSLLEAASSGRLILTTDVPGCRDFVRDGKEGFIVPVGDAAALAEKIVLLANDPALVARMGAAARARILDGYTEQAVTGTIIRLYKDMMA